MANAVFGGAFNPPHSEHVRIAREICGCLPIDKLYVIPTRNAPHKHSDVSFEHRLNMCRIAFSGISGVEVSDIDSTVSNVNYTVKMLPIYREKLNSEYFIIGGDSLMCLESWYMPRDICALTNIVVVPRGEDTLTAVKEKIAYFNTLYHTEIKLLPVIGKLQSSQETRAEIETQGSSGAVPSAVMDYIAKQGLYKQYASLLARIKATEREETFLHSMSTARYALKLNSALGLDFDEVFTAAVLHDVAKHKPYAGEPIPKTAIGTKIMHQYLGAIYAKERFGVTNKSILQAIKYHSTSHLNATPLDKLLFMADSLEETRDYPEVEGLRSIVERDFEEGYRAFVDFTYHHVLERGLPVYGLTYRVYAALFPKVKRN